MDRQLTHNTEVVIIGGGVIAKSIAVELSNNNIPTIIISSPDHNKMMASRAAGALLGVFSECSSLENDDQMRTDVLMRLKARKMYDRWVSDLVHESGKNISSTTGLFVIANPTGDRDSAELKLIESTAKHFRRKIDWVSPNNIIGLHPSRKNSSYSGLFIHDEGTVNARELLDSLEEILLNRKNIRVIKDRAIKISKTPTHISLMCASGEKISCEKIILAGGAFMNQLLNDVCELSDIQIPPVFASRGVGISLKTKLNFPHCIRTPNRAFACGIHAVPLSNGGLYIGSTNRLTTSAERRSLPDISEVNNLLNGTINEINTSLRNAEIVDMYVGYRPITIDGRPLVGKTAIPGILLATGTYRNGILLAPLIAEAICRELMGKVDKNFPYSPLRKFHSELQTDPKTWLEKASRALMESILEPGGHLPYNREDELQNYLRVTLGDIVAGRSQETLLNTKVARLLSRVPLIEVVPLLWELIHRHKDERD